MNTLLKIAIPVVLLASIAAPTNGLLGLPYASAYCNISSASAAAANAFNLPASAWAFVGPGSLGTDAHNGHASVSATGLAGSAAHSETTGAAATCAIYGSVCSGGPCPPPPPNGDVVAKLAKLKFSLKAWQNPLLSSAVYAGSLYETPQGDTWFVGTQSVGGAESLYAQQATRDGVLTFDNEATPASAAPPQDLAPLDVAPLHVTFGFDAATLTNTGYLGLGDSVQ